MTTDGGNLAQKEFALIQEISRKPTHTQRSLSQSVGLSLGTTNLLIQRLARKGYIKSGTAARYKSRLHTRVKVVLGEVKK